MQDQIFDYSPRDPTYGLCVLVGSRRALAIAVNNNPVAHRYTALAERLEGRGKRNG